MSKFYKIWSSWGGWRLTLGVILAPILLCLAFHQTNLEELLATARQGQWIWLAAALVVMSCQLGLRALRWQILLSAEKSIALLTVFWGLAAGYLGNTLLPARAGELIRSVLLGQKAQLSKSFVLATALTERIFDALTLVLVAFAAIRQLGLAASWLAPALNGMLAVGFIGLALLLASRRLERPLLALLARLPLPQRFRPALDSFTRNFLLGMRSFQHPGRAVGFASLTAIIWLGDGLTANLVARAFGLNLALPGALLLISALGLSSAVPSTPGYIGVYQFVAVTVLMPLGFLRSEALACSITLQAVSVVGCLLWGSLGLWRLGGLPQRARDE